MFTQTGDEQWERMLNENSKPNQLKESVKDAKEFLINLADEQSWNVTSVDENGIQVKAQRLLCKLCFRKLKAKS